MDGQDGVDGRNGTNGTDGQDGTNGNDANDGLTPATAKITIAAGIGLCASGATQNDVVYVLQYPSTPPGAEAWPIVVDVESIHIIGAGWTPGQDGLHSYGCSDLCIVAENRMKIYIINCKHC